MTSADKNGIDGFALYFPSKVSGGARSADDVIAQITIKRDEPDLRARTGAGHERQRDKGGA